MPPSMVADVIDWDEAETGRRREGSYFAIWAFVTKFCVAITGFKFSSSDLQEVQQKVGRAQEA